MCALAITREWLVAKTNAPGQFAGNLRQRKPMPAAKPGLARPSSQSREWWLDVRKPAVDDLAAHHRRQPLEDRRRVQSARSIVQLSRSLCPIQLNSMDLRQPESANKEVSAPPRVSRIDQPPITQTNDAFGPRDRRLRFAAGVGAA
jgi:hypothetical protein